MKRNAALIFAACVLIVVLFQVALAAGAPWGSYAMGGAFPGQFPPPLRMAAIVQAALLAAMAGLVLARAGLILPRWVKASRTLIWLVVAFCTLGLVLNLITPSALERAIWAPVTLVLLVSSALVATDRRGKRATP